MNGPDIRRQPIGSHQAIEAWRDEMEGFDPFTREYDSVEADHELEVPLERGNLPGDC